MSSKYPDQRVGVVVDLANLYYGARLIHRGKKVHFKNFLASVVDGRKLVRAIAYGVRTAEGMEEKFFEALETAGFEVRTKELQIFSDGSKKGDWDVGMAIDAVKMARNLDVVILGSGDGDFVPLVEYLHSTSGCRVEVAAFRESASGRLTEIADDFINLSANPRRFLIA